LGGSAITNIGNTVISDGNVGLFPTTEAAITGIPPAVIVGGTIIATGPITQQAQIDFNKAAMGLAGMAANVNLTGQDLGGMILPPGVYSFDAAAMLTGTLTLDAEGQNNAYWVFQIDTTLTTTTGSNVTVINYGSHGGNDDGVFWNARPTPCWGIIWRARASPMALEARAKHGVWPWPQSHWTAISSVQGEDPGAATGRAGWGTT
jgi:hypothetical protein